MYFYELLLLSYDESSSGSIFNMANGLIQSSGSVNKLNSGQLNEMEKKEKVRRK